MKSQYRFLYMLLLLYLISTSLLYGIIEDKKNYFNEEISYYVPNNPSNPKATMSDLDNLKLEATNIIGVDKEGNYYYTEFDNIKLISGRLPNEGNEYISLKENNDDNLVGLYQMTLSSFEGMRDIYKLVDDTPYIIQLEFKKDSNYNENDLVNLGFIKIDNENLDKKINAEFYNLLGVILQIFLFTILLITLIFLLATLTRYIQKNKKKIEALKSMGATTIEIILVFLSLQHKMLIKIFIEMLLIYNIIALVGYLTIKVYWFTLFNTYIIIFFAFIISLYIIVMLFNLYKEKFRKIINLLFLIALASIIIVFNLNTNHLFELIVLIIPLAFIYFYINNDIFIKAIFSKLTNSSSSLIWMLTSIVIIFCLIANIYMDYQQREDATVDTTIPTNILVQLDKEDYEKNIIDSNLFDKQYYINPIAGIIKDEKTYFPLIYSTNLEMYKDLILDGKPVSKDSVAIGYALSKASNTNINDYININGTSVKVTNIVNSYQYAGQIIYMDKEKFISIFRDTGSEYYLSDLNEEEAEKVLNQDDSYTYKIISKEKYREFYRNSVNNISLLLSVICIVLSCLGGIIIYKLFFIYLDNAKKEISIMRGFGMSALEFYKFSCKRFISISIISIIISVLLYDIFTSRLSQLILDVSGSYIKMSISLNLIIFSVVILYIIITIVILITFKKLEKKSIYSLYLETFIE